MTFLDKPLIITLRTSVSVPLVVQSRYLFKCHYKTTNSCGLVTANAAVKDVSTVIALYEKKSRIPWLVLRLIWS
jgi:hypothetical protein